MTSETRLGLESRRSEVEALCATAHWCYDRGWVPATSGNFSVRAAQNILITPSGLDKSRLEAQDLLEVDGEGHVVMGHDISAREGKPSAEACLHMVIYRERPEASAILHVHTIWNTVLSGRFADAGYVAIEGYELLKGLDGVTSHEHVEKVPILDNSQDYSKLSRKLEGVLDELPRTHGVLLSRHGLYTWGKSVAEARRHLEALEFLFEAEGRRLMSPLG